MEHKAEANENEKLYRQYISSLRKLTGAVSSLTGVIWSIGWLFTIGYAKLVGWQIVIALVVWPYYLGVAAR